MNAIPWYQSPVYIGAVVSIISQLLVLFDLGDKVAPEQVAKYVDATFQILALGAAAYAAWKRQSSTIQPLVLTKASAVAKSSHGGFARPVFLAGLAALVLVGVGLSACSGTRAAYRAAENPAEYAYVVADHYNALVNEAANLKESGVLTGQALARVQAADRAAKPLVLGLRPLVEAYGVARSAETEAALQAALNEAVRQIAEFVRLLRAAQATSPGANLSPRPDRIVYDAAVA